jgi:hypothetical protein
MADQIARIAEIVRAAHDAKGRRVREVWIAWAKEQPNPKPSWLTPYDELEEVDKEADRRIGSALWADGFHEGHEAGLAAAIAILNQGEE